MEGIFLANFQTLLSRNRIKMKSENASTDVAMLEYNLFLLHLTWIPRKQTNKRHQQKKVAKSNFRSKLSPMEHFGYIQRNRLWTMVDFNFNLFFQNVSGKAMLQDTTRGSLLFLALFPGF